MRGCKVTIVVVAADLANRCVDHKSGQGAHAFDRELIINELYISGVQKYR